MTTATEKYEFAYLKGWGDNMDSDGGLDGWENFGASEPREYYYQRAIAYAYAPGAGVILEESN